jgi:hypothetical protein
MADVEDCPEAFRGASISTADIRDGVTLTFTTEHARIAIMRDELRTVASMVEQKGTEVQTTSYEEDVEFPPLDLEVFDVTGGARVSVRASRPRDIPELRVLAKSFEKFWATSKCNGFPSSRGNAQSKRRLPIGDRHKMPKPTDAPACPRPSAVIAAASANPTSEIP